jgi:hypothetical protein
MKIGDEEIRILKNACFELMRRKDITILDYNEMWDFIRDKLKLKGYRIEFRESLEGKLGCYQPSKKTVVVMLTGNRDIDVDTFLEEVIHLLQGRKMVKMEDLKADKIEKEAKELKVKIINEVKTFFEKEGQI